MAVSSARKKGVNLLFIVLTHRFCLRRSSPPWRSLEPLTNVHFWPIADPREGQLWVESGHAQPAGAAIMSLIQSARMNGHDPYAYFKVVLMRLPTQRASEVEQLLPHQWAAAWQYRSR